MILPLIVSGILYCYLGTYATHQFFHEDDYEGLYEGLYKCFIHIGVRLIVREANTRTR
jgi:hypothetical protein